jgi:hypothetical protein
VVARYDAFLLRIWRSGEGPERRWSIRLEHLPDGRAARLDSLEALAAHLTAVLSEEGNGLRQPIRDHPAGGIEETGG